MSHDLDALPAGFVESLQQRYFATLATVRGDGRPHAVTVGFVYDAGDRVARVVSRDGTVKVTNIDAGSPAALSQTDGQGRWLTLEGQAKVVRQRAAHSVARAAYDDRYGPSRIPTDVVIEISVDRAVGMWP